MDVLAKLKQQSNIPVPDQCINKTLSTLAELLIQNSHKILAANKKDLNFMDSEDPRYDRLLLTESRIQGIAEEVQKVISLPSPLNKVLTTYNIEANLHLKKITVPLGVIAMIYEARPNVTIDAFTLCFKSGNACALKGGKEAIHSNTALVEQIHEALTINNLSTDWVALIHLDRLETHKLLTAQKSIDVVIPRGSHKLIQYVRENATVPVIETGAGVVHAYIDQSFDIETAQKVIMNAKTRRVSVCNALDCILIHEKQLSNLFTVVNELASKQVTIFADTQSLPYLERYPVIKPANAEHFGYEFLDYKISIKTVASLDEAIQHINRFGSHHSDTIISTDPEAIQQFQSRVDSSVVYSNASTAFTDGAQFGLGAEIGISTQKLHARGPMGLEALTTTKFIVDGHANIRN